MIPRLTNAPKRHRNSHCSKIYTTSHGTFSKMVYYPEIAQVAHTDYIAKSLSILKIRNLKFEFLRHELWRTIVQYLSHGYTVRRFRTRDKYTFF